MVNSSDPNYIRNRQWYLDREKSKEGVAKRTARQRSRREAVKDGRITKSDAREVDHKTPLSKGGGSHKANTRITSATANRKKFDK